MKVDKPFIKGRPSTSQLTLSTAPTVGDQSLLMNLVMRSDQTLFQVQLNEISQDLGLLLLKVHCLVGPALNETSGDKTQLSHNILHVCSDIVLCTQDDALKTGSTPQTQILKLRCDHICKSSAQSQSVSVQSQRFHMYIAVYDVLSQSHSSSSLGSAVCCDTGPVDSNTSLN